MASNDKSPIVVSVVRDYEMYNRCIKGNQFTDECELHPIDNRKDNETIPVLYNQVIDQIDLSGNRWIIFAHEDFEPLENLALSTQQLDTASIWGPIGAITTSRWPWLLGGYRQAQIRGCIATCHKNGANEGTTGLAASCGTIVDTLDCMFIAVHTSMLRETHLRFDENLTFDLYSEDFSIQAKHRHNISTRVFPLKCKHHSGSMFAPRFYTQRNYLKIKYPSNIAASTTSYFIGGGGSAFWRLQIFLRDKLPR